ncbi:hypothetical protein Hypma_004758 [Hypsizygus marmoreus]|uniref:Uncharacterized protein n=1 Tax=Hypsizygus marmoreus TaxID=39966 RepID=A0A369J4I4_HYPMA|nr:hypothetical protein Hypma_004758 [Hypsizygus marmoreus]
MPSTTDDDRKYYIIERTLIDRPSKIRGSSESHLLCNMTSVSQPSATQRGVNSKLPFTTDQSGEDGGIGRTR